MKNNVCFHMFLESKIKDIKCIFIGSYVMALPLLLICLTRDQFGLSCKINLTSLVHNTTFAQ